MSKMTRRDAFKGAAVLAAAGMLPTTAKAEDKKRLKIIVAGAHPDDPESSSGGTMALYADAGHEVVSLYLTRGEAGIHGKSHEEAAKIRTAEAEAACKILHARPVFLTQIDGSTELNADRYDEAWKVIKEEMPDILITHWPIDGHRDHRIMSLLMYDAWLHAKKKFELFYYETESGMQTQHFGPTHYMDITATEDRKRQACYAHPSQNAEKGFYVLHDEMNRFRGQEAGVPYAEAFIRHNQSGRVLGLGSGV